MDKNHNKYNVTEVWGRLNLQSVLLHMDFTLSCDDSHHYITCCCQTRRNRRSLKAYKSCFPSLIWRDLYIFHQKTLESVCVVMAVSDLYPLLLLLLASVSALWCCNYLPPLRANKVRCTWKALFVWKVTGCSVSTTMFFDSGLWQC